ncbi:hypothetical protein SAMN04488511_1167 [Pedobacter suwonensis]|uniref:Uncharacterized protein n=1 Tax=Pedobacter suwonensis TaxID=332999 RepID=A0A1I0TXB2_9SPHI|nr:hypothetical protein [Pedobacter suwonensis]SFA56454.1 hypothetical protein SAMN04488511_1167 [Pedobacter suwonensis]
MTPELIQKYRQAAKDGSLPEDENPLLLFAQTGTNLLVRLLDKDVNLVTLIRLTLLERGVNEKGKWIGFEKAKQLRDNLLASRKKITPSNPPKSPQP